MLKYLRSGRAGVRARAPLSGGLMVGLMPRAALLEDTGDHLIERRILNGHVEDGVTVENGAEHLRDARPLHLEAGHRSFAARHLAEHLQTVGNVGAVEMKFD